MRPVPSGFMTAVRVYSEAFCERPDLKNGNKIILPQSALSELARLKVSYPMIFRAVNIPMSRKCYCGVLEFIAEEGVCYMPHWMMNNLFLEEGAEVHIQNVTLPKGTFVAIQPHETAFIDLANPKAILENELTNYACLTKGETINICYGGKDFLIDIVETLPHEAICVVEADIEVDFRQPKDYQEIPLKKKSSKLVVNEETERKIEEEGYDEKYTRVDGKPLTKKQKKELFQKKQEGETKEDENFDPRQHRLKHGIRNYDKHFAKFNGTGTKIK